jgi:hypothetical protein
VLRDIKIGENDASRQKVRRLTARQMRFIEYGWRGIFREILFTFSTLFWSFLIGMYVYALLNRGDLEATNASAYGVVVLFYFAVLIFIISSAWWQLGAKHYYNPGKSMARFRLTEEAIKKIFSLGSLACTTLFILLIILIRLGLSTGIRTLPGTLAGLGISFYFASKLIKLHGDTDQIASKYIASTLEGQNADIILSYQSFKYSPKKGSRVVGATNELLFSANHDGTDWITTVIPFSEIKSIGMRAASRRSFSLDQPLYLPSAARVVIQAHDGVFYKIPVETPDGFQTNCFLFCKGLLRVIDRYLGAKYSLSHNPKSLKRSVDTTQSHYIESSSEKARVCTFAGRSILINSSRDAERAVTPGPSKRLGNRAIAI